MPKNAASRLVYCSSIPEAPSARIRIFLNPQLVLSGYENIRVHTLCDHSVFISNSPVHTYSDSLRIHWGLTKLSHHALVRPSLINPESSRTAMLSYSFKLFLPAVLSCRCQAAFWHNLFQHLVERHLAAYKLIYKRLEISPRNQGAQKLFTFDRRPCLNLRGK